MLRLRLLIVTLVMMLVGSAAADDNAETLVGPHETPVFSLSRNTTLSCSARLPSGVFGCFIERPVIVLGNFEFAVGVDVQLPFRDISQSHLAPYGIFAYYADTWSAWAELRLPELAGVPVIGDADYLRIGFTTRF